MQIVCSDLEGVWVPEVWKNVAEKTGIEKLKLTTRDIKDYDELMQYRLRILDEEGLTLRDIQEVISTIKPMEGALEMIKWIQSRTRFVLVSDTFEEFAEPLMKQLDYPTLLCHSLEVDEKTNITGYKLRQPDPKRKTVEAFQSLKYEVIAFGDSYNDATMVEQAEKAFWFLPPQSVIDDFPHVPVANDYDEMKRLLIDMGV